MGTEEAVDLPGHAGAMLLCAAGWGRGRYHILPNSLVLIIVGHLDTGNLSSMATTGHMSIRLNYCTRSTLCVGGTPPVLPSAAMLNVAVRRQLLCVSSRLHKDRLQSHPAGGLPAQGLAAPTMNRFKGGCTADRTVTFGSRRLDKQSLKLIL